jgi:hypothetical protein
MEFAENRDREGHQQLLFKKAFSWGTSTRNIRIERWWKSLATSALNEFREYFQSLSNARLFDNVCPDRIAIRYIYMPLIRERLVTFMEIHNIHVIRKQRFRSHYLPTGKPRILFEYPQHGVDFHEKVDFETLEWLEGLVKDVDIDSYLPRSMMELCATILEDVGYSHDSIAGLKFNKQSPHKRHYLILRERLQRIFAESEILQEEGTPCGARAWISQHISLSEDQEIMEHYTGAQFQQLHLDQDPVSSQNLDEDEDEDDQDGYGSEVEVLDYQDYEELEVQ